MDEKLGRFKHPGQSPSEKPGLGVALDPEKLARFHEIYRRKEVVDGSYRRDDMKREVDEANLHYPKF